ncbi:MAG: aspartate-semialdehyde dehydrogenase [Thermoplasmata archaeon]|nr:aspartate-semialdehyde dehydrogenase [Thermoplasmata archaeon]
MAPLTSARHPVAILGAAGYIGQQFVRLLADHPWFEPRWLLSGPRTTGRHLSELWQLAGERMPTLGDDLLRTMRPAALARAGAFAVFSALPSGTARDVETELGRRGVHVFSNAADHRGDRPPTLLLPEVNGSEARTPRRGRAWLLTNPNCTATGLALALRPVLPLLEPRAIHVASYQSLSGAGLPGLPSLATHGNVIPFIEAEEEKVSSEGARLLGLGRPGSARSVPILAHCARVPVREGHLESVTVEARRRPALRSLLEAWRRFDPLALDGLPSAPHPPVELRPEVDRPQPVLDLWAGDPARARGMAVSVGRVRWTPPHLRFTLLVHNAVRGGAGGSVLNAEFAMVRGWLPLGA